MESFKTAEIYKALHASPVSVLVVLSDNRGGQAKWNVVHPIPLNTVQDRHEARESAAERMSNCDDIGFLITSTGSNIIKKLQRKLDLTGASSQTCEPAVDDVACTYDGVWQKAWVIGPAIRNDGLGLRPYRITSLEFICNGIKASFPTFA